MGLVMWPDWNAIESLAAWRTVLQYLGITLIVVGTGLGAVSVWFGNRIEELDSDMRRALQERLEVTEMQAADAMARHEPRHITEDQRRQFLDLVHNARKGTIKVASVMGDSEAHAYALEIAALLRDAGWTLATQPVAQVVLTGPPVLGLVLFIRTSETAPADAGVLQEAFGTIGIESPARLNDGEPPHSVTVFIGHRP